MLTAKQELFVKELIDGKTQRQAYYVAYPKSRAWKEKTVDNKAYALFKKDGVKARYNELLTRIAKRVEKKCLVDAEYIIGNLKEVAERGLQKRPVMVRRGKDVVQATDEEDRAIWQFDSMGANRSLELMGKSIKMFTDKVEVVDGTGVAALLRERRKAAAEKLKCKPNDK